MTGHPEEYIIRSREASHQRYEEHTIPREYQKAFVISSISHRVQRRQKADGKNKSEKEKRYNMVSVLVLRDFTLQLLNKIFRNMRTMHLALQKIPERVLGQLMAKYDLIPALTTMLPLLWIGLAGPVEWMANIRINFVIHDKNDIY